MDFEVVAGEGSSPRVRGRPSSSFPASARASAHPRGCGADSSPRFIRSLAAGSSPRVRGRQGVAVRNEAVPGLIPAGAGQT